MIRVSQYAILSVLSLVRDNKKLAYDMLKQIHNDLSTRTSSFVNECKDMVGVIENELHVIKQELQEIMDDVSHKQIGNQNMLFGVKTVDKRIANDKNEARLLIR